MNEGLNVKLASIGARLVSCVADTIILSVAGFIIFDKIFRYFDFFTILFFWLSIQAGYYTYFFGNGQTPGMKVVKIKLIRTDGTYLIGYTKGFLRWIGIMISGLMLYLGFLQILTDKNRQGWHDEIADTYVVVE